MLRTLTAGEMGFWFVERLLPTGFVLRPCFFVVQQRVREGQLGAFGDGAESYPTRRYAGIFRPPVQRAS